jgi:hypothetical protein
MLMIGPGFGQKRKSRLAHLRQVLTDRVQLLHEMCSHHCCEEAFSIVSSYECGSGTGVESRRLRNANMELNPCYAFAAWYRWSS